MFHQYYAQVLAGKSPNETPKQHTRKVFLFFISPSLPWRNFSDQEARLQGQDGSDQANDTTRHAQAKGGSRTSGLGRILRGDEAPDSNQNNVSIEVLNTGAQELTSGIGGSGRCAALRAVRRAVR